MPRLLVDWKKIRRNAEAICRLCSHRGMLLAFHSPHVEKVCLA